jgi:hypothetical protein
MREGGRFHNQVLTPLSVNRRIGYQKASKLDDGYASSDSRTALSSPAHVGLCHFAANAARFMKFADWLRFELHSKEAVDADGRTACFTGAHDRILAHRERQINAPYIFA